METAAEVKEEPLITAEEPAVEKEEPIVTELIVTEPIVTEPIVEKEEPIVTEEPPAIEEPEQQIAVAEVADEVDQDIEEDTAPPERQRGAGTAIRHGDSSVGLPERLGPDLCSLKELSEGTSGKINSKKQDS